MKYLLFVTVFIMINLNSFAQQEADLPYKEIPSYPSDYTAGNVLARMIDGLGYRYYWASEGLDEEEMNYKPSDDARTLYQTIEHLYGLSDMILNSMLEKPNVRPSEWSFDSHQELRSATLKNFKKASDLMLSKTSEEVEVLKISFQNGDNKSEVAFWHMINGPIADAIYHTGQVVSFRRTLGNPMNPKVNVFMGKTGQ